MTQSFAIDRDASSQGHELYGRHRRTCRWFLWYHQWQLLATCKCTIFRSSNRSHHQLGIDTFENYVGTRIWQIEILLILLNTRSTSVESLMCEFDNEKVIRLFNMISSSSQQKFQVYTKFSFAFHEIKKNALPSLLPSQVQNLIFQRCEEELSDAKQSLQNCSINSCIQDSCIFMHRTWLAAMLFIIKISSIFHYSEKHKFILHSSSKGFCSKL